MARRNPHAVTSLPNGNLVVTLYKTPDGFGLKFGAPQSDAEAADTGYGVYVAAVKKKGAAKEVPQIKKGMQIIRINDTRLDKGLTRDVEAVLKAHGRDNKLIIEFVDDDTLFKACTGSRQKFEIGHRVKIGARVKGAWNADYPCPGTVRFAGPHHAGKGERVLVELDQPVGKNNGIIDGHQYYKLDELHGVLVKPDKLQLVERRMLFRRGRAGYGIKFGGATAANLTGVFISDYVAGGAAEAMAGSDLVKGWQIMAINDVDTSMFKMAQMMPILRSLTDETVFNLQENAALFGKFTKQKGGKGAKKKKKKMVAGAPPAVQQAAPTMTFAPQQSAGGVAGSARVPTDGSRIFTVMKDKANPDLGFGVVFGGAVDASQASLPKGVFVAEVFGPALNTLGLIPGLQVVAVNGNDVGQATLTELKGILEASQEFVNLTTKPNDALYAAYNGAGARTVELVKGPDGFGVSFGGKPNMAAAGPVGIVIKGLKAGAPVSSNPEAYNSVGWQITHLQGVDITGFTFGELTPLIKEKVTDRMTVQLAMNEELRRWFMPKYGIGSSYDMKVELGQPGHEIVYGGAKDGAEAKTTRGGVFVAEVLESGKHYHALHKQVIWANGTDTQNATLTDMKGIIETAANGGAVLNLRVIDNPGLTDAFGGFTAAEAVAVEVTRASDTAKFGLEFAGAEDASDAANHGYGIYVAAVEAGGLAAAAGVVEGYQVTKLGGEAAIEWTMQDMLAALGKGDGNTLKLELRSNVDLASRYTAKFGKPLAVADAALEGNVQVQLVRGTQGFGLSFGGAKDEAEAKANGHGIFLAGTKPGGVAETCDDITVGMKVLRLNGVDCTNSYASQFEQVLRCVGKEMELVLEDSQDLYKKYAAQNRRARRLVGTSVRRNPAAGKAVTKTVLAKGPGGYGLRFGGPKNTEEGEKFGFGIFIAGKKEGGVAESNADIRINEQLLKINDTDLINATIDDLSGLLGSIGASMELTLVKNPALAKTYGQTGKGVGRGGNLRSSMARGKGKGAPPAAAQAPRAMESFQEAPPQPAAPVAVAVEAPQAAQAPNDGLIRVELAKGAGGFGLRFGGPKDHAQGAEHGFGICISGMKPNSTASAIAELHAGLQVLSVNGQDLTEATFEDLKRVIQGHVKGSMSLVLKDDDTLYNTYNLVQAREKEAKSKAGPAKVTATSITRGPKGFGIIFGGAKTEDEAKQFGRGIFILKVKGDSVASQNAHLKRGLQIKSINGTDLTNAIMLDLKPVIQGVKQDMNFELVENPVLYAAYKSRYATLSRDTLKKSKAKEMAAALRAAEAEEAAKDKAADRTTKFIVLEKGAKGFGLSFGGAKEQQQGAQIGAGVFVSAVKEGGVAAAHPDITVGQHIISINGQDTTKCILPDLRPILMKTGNKMQLALSNDMSLYNRFQDASLV